MSQYYDIGEETLWNPANGASRMFRHQVAVFEAELGITSGVAPMENDECQIDPVALGVFVNALLAEHRRTTHAVRLALSEGFVAVMLVLAERAGVTVDWSSHERAPGGPLHDVQVLAGTGMAAPAEGGAWSAGLRERARDLGRRMPR
ncbi:DUF6086 family protein [Streptomyces sp. NPDC056144]|uniref:DUF6086 family protein n=1 Tax=unclassified Streptomyces TaxID=2593676 RepID=UPI0035D8AA29